MLRTFLVKVDNVICNLYALKGAVIAQKINKETQEIIVTTDHKRFPERTNLKNLDVDELTANNKKLLGIALGQTVAKNLAIHFTNEK